MARDGGVTCAFVIFLSVATAFLIAVFGCYIYAMLCVSPNSNVSQRGLGLNSNRGLGWAKSARQVDQVWIAIWTLCFILMLTMVIFGWMWFCCCGGCCMALFFTIVAALAMVFFICLVALFPFYDMAIGIGVVGMILCLAMTILGAIAMCIG